jgi:hypothetical protein
MAVAELLGEFRRQLEAAEARAENEDPRHGQEILFGAIAGRPRRAP